MSDSGLEALDAQQAVEARLTEAGVDQIRHTSFADAPEAAPDTGTPAEEVSADIPRNELGQFVGQEPDTTAEAPAEEIQSEPESQDAAVSAFLQKYGGDVDKALAGAVHLQRKAGEQSNELGDLRRMVDELSQLRETVQADYQQRQRNQPLDQATVDWFDQAVIDNPQQAMAWAQQQNNQMLLQRGLDTWKQVDPYSAAVYTNQLQNAQMYQQMQQELQQVKQLPQDATLNMALQSVRNRNPQFTNYDDALGDTLEKYPFQAQLLQSAAASGDTQQLEGAIETLYALAERDTLRSLALTGPAPESTTTSEAVATPTTSEDHEPAPAPSQVDEFRASFKAEAERARRGVWVAE